MVKRALFCICLVLAFSHGYGQDIITRTDGIEIRATDLNIQPNRIQFRLFGQPDTLTYQISPRDVHVIKMADGSVRNFSTATSSVAKEKGSNYETGLGRNILYFYPADLLFTNFTFAYERISASGKIGFRVPITFGLNGITERYYNDNFRRNTRYGGGLELNIYPYGQGKFEYFFGPTLNFKSFRSFYYDRSPQPTLPQEDQALMVAVGFKNGIYYQLSETFVFAIDVGLGLRFYPRQESPDTYYTYDSRTLPYVPGNLQVGFRF